ncbi:MAG TPA: hypothetical protein VGQ36_17035 [Thermoanaerobaculia bacterium]|jgi:hypothetical protein|nr:hypothetical protein [Thermoanaerobaculia bacterium]
MVRHIVLFLSLLLVYPLFGSAERPISDVRIGVVGTMELRSMVGAGSAEGFLVAWTSKERGGQAMRVDLMGRVDATSIGLPFAPRFVFRKDDLWFVVGNEGWVRLDRDGALLDRRPRLFPQPLARIIGGAWTGRALVLATHESSVLTAVSLDADMKVTGTRTLSRVAHDPITIRVATDGRSVVIIMNDTKYETTSIFDADGVFMKSTEHQTFRKLAALGSEGRNYVAVYEQIGDGCVGKCFVSRPFDIRTSSSSLHRVHVEWADHIHAPTLSWDGNELSFFYAADEEIRAVRIDRDGQWIANNMFMKADVDDIDIDAGFYGVSAAGTTLILYGKFVAGPRSDVALHMRAAHEANQFEDVEEIALEIGATSQEGVAAASNDTMSLVIWRERIERQVFQIRGARVARDGSILDATAIRIAQGICSVCEPAIASNGETFMIAWYSTAYSFNDVYVMLYDANGARTKFWRIGRAPSGVGGVLRGKPTIVVRGKEYSVFWSFGGKRYLSSSTVDIHSPSAPYADGEDVAELHGASNGAGYLLASGGRASFVDNAVALNETDISGDRVSAVWWNGASYSVLHGDATTDSITRFDANGVFLGTAGPFARPQLPKWGVTSDPACDAKGCSTTFGTIEDGRFLLSHLRVDDDGTNVSYRVRAAVDVPSSQQQGEEMMGIAPLQVAGGPLLAAYTRRELAPPYAGISRVFLSPFVVGRTRTVRH